MRDASFLRSLFRSDDRERIEALLRESLDDPDRQTTAAAMLRGMLGKNSPLYLFDELHVAPLTKKKIETYRTIALKVLCEDQLSLLRLLPELIRRSHVEAAKDLYFSLAKYLPECAEVQPQTPLLLMLLSLYLADFGDLRKLCCQASCRYGFRLLFATLHPDCRCDGEAFALRMIAPNPFEPDWEKLREAIRGLEPYDETALARLLDDWPPAVVQVMTQKLQRAYETSESLRAPDHGDEKPQSITKTITQSETLPIK